MAAEVRLKKLEELVLDRSVVHVETLVDLFLCVHHELSTSPLAQEKYIMEFLQWGELTGCRDPLLGLPLAHLTKKLFFPLNAFRGLVFMGSVFTHEKILVFSFFPPFWCCWTSNNVCCDTERE